MRLINRHPDRSGRLLLILLPFALLLFVYFSASTRPSGREPQ
jgi:NitT/TauT family transport system permease protein